jgi:hypothetical protein
MGMTCSNVPTDCRACGRRKKPWGRSAPLEMCNGLCDQDCEGYLAEPFPPTRWPGEACDKCDPRDKDETP